MPQSVGRFTILSKDGLAGDIEDLNNPDEDGCLDGGNGLPGA